jgi:hypothetical protein
VYAYLYDHIFCLGNFLLKHLLTRATFFNQQRVRSGLEAIIYTPLVSEANKDQWGQYSYSQQGWIEESRAIVANAQGELEGKSALVGIDSVIADIAPIIWEVDPDYNPIPAVAGPDPYAPFWQMSPPPFSPIVINYNLFDEPFSLRMYQVAEVVKGERGNSTAIGNAEVRSHLYSLTYLRAYLVFYINS